MTDEASIDPGSALGQILSADKAPPLAEGFADRVIARTADRPAPLPPGRRAAGGGERWRSVRRLAIGGVVAGALATTAAATGLLDSLPIAVPSVEQVWATITGEQERSEPADAGDSVVPQPTSPEVQEPVILDGLIDSPEELEEAFRRVDDVRSKRSDTRRERVDRRIDDAIDRRRQQGLRAPTPEQEERLRERIDRFREQRDTQIGERLETRRDELRERVDNGEELSREDFIREQRDAVGRPGRRDRLERLRELSPEERRNRLRQFRERRQERRLQRLEQQSAPPLSGDEPAASDDTIPAPDPSPGTDNNS